MKIFFAGVLVAAVGVLGGLLWSNYGTEAWLLGLGMEFFGLILTAIVLDA